MYIYHMNNIYLHLRIYAPCISTDIWLMLMEPVGKYLSPMEDIGYSEWLPNPLNSQSSVAFKKANQDLWNLVGGAPNLLHLTPTSPNYSITRRNIFPLCGWVFSTILSVFLFGS